MTTLQEKAQCVFWFIETKSDVQTQRNYLTKHGRDPLSRPIRSWNKKFMEPGLVFGAGRRGRPRTYEENIERVRQAFHHFAIKSICIGAKQLKLPRSTVHKLHRRTIKSLVLHARCFLQMFLVTLSFLH